MKLDKEKIKNYILSRKIIPKILCLLFSIFLWAYVINSKTKERKILVAIETKNLPKDYVISHMPKKYIRITVKGNEDEIRNINNRNLKAFVNLDEPSLGEFKKYPISLFKPYIPDSVILDMNEKFILIKVENKLSKLVPIVADISKLKSDDNLIGNIVIIPGRIKINGPASIINDITEISTEIISMNKNNKSINQKIKLNIDEFKKKNINIDVTRVRVKVPIYSAKNIIVFQPDVTLLNVPDNYNCVLFNEKVNIYIKTEREDIAISRDDFKAYLDLAHISSKSFYIKKKKVTEIIKEFPVYISNNKSKTGIIVVDVVPNILEVKIKKNK